MAKLTKEEVLAAYGDVPLTFSHYYKYQFTFSGEAPDGVTIYATFGDGSSDGIYKTSIKSTTTMTLNEDEPDIFGAHRDGKTLYEQYETGW